MAGRRERAVWGPEEEDVLLQLFLAARADPELRSERGVRGHGWQRMAADLNARCQRSFDKGASVVVLLLGGRAVADWVGLG